MMTGDKEFGRRAVSPIPLSRVLDKLDALTAKKDYAEAARFLEYWRGEARLAGDLRGEFTLLNEAMGVYRKAESREEAMECAEKALALIESIGNEGTISAGTAYVNAGTVYQFCGETQKALACFRKAQEIYERELPAQDKRLASLYNNMALALTAAGEYERAFACYQFALEGMEEQQYGELEQAITYLNMANAAEAVKGQEEAEEEIREYLDKAEALLMEKTLPRNSYYAFVCEKCFPTFSYYGWFRTAQDLKDAAESIYNKEICEGETV
ncbi:MAG: tetratricopeptide repeat protein [Clostridia bacterium]|nr:tetratricopeptide repeat protein [Clostridia bacterium]